MAEYYSVELSQKIKRGMTTNANKCYYNGGSVPLGFKLVTAETLSGHNNSKIEKKKFAIDEEKALIVQKIFEMYADGSTMADIIRYLNEKNLKTSRENEFNKNSLRKMLLNKKYIGVYSYDNQEVKNAIPSIIEEDLFYRVREKMLKNKETPQRARAKTTYLLTTKLFCGKCKSMMVGYSGTSKTEKLHCYYGCKGTWSNKCTRKGISKDYIEEFVATKARDILTNEVIDHIANTIVKLTEKEKEKTRIKFLEKALRKNEKSKTNLIDSIKECGIDSVKKSIFQEIAKLEEENKEIQKQIRIEENNIVKLTAPQIKFFLKEIRKLNIDNMKCRQMLINMLVYKVYLYDDNISIVFTTQDKYYEANIPKLSELESSLMGNQPPPLFPKMNIINFIGGICHKCKVIICKGKSRNFLYFPTFLF